MSYVSASLHLCLSACLSFAHGLSTLPRICVQVATQITILQPRIAAANTEINRFDMARKFHDDIR